MYKFHQIPTLDYEPISHDKTYLFSNYERLSNFLVFNLDRKSSDILAKPIQTSNFVDWYSNFNNLIPIDNLSIEDKENALLKYWEFLEKINSLIAKLRSTKEPDKINWSNILEKTFNSQNNIIFTNGEDIAIIWGWQFFNNKNYKPSILQNIPTIVDTPSETPINISTIEESIIDDNIEVVKEDQEETPLEIQEQVVEEPLIINEEIEELNDKSSGFLGFLKWIASKYWWIMLLLLLILLLLLLLKNCENEARYRHLNHEIENLENNLNQVCN